MFCDFDIMASLSRHMAGIAANEIPAHREPLFGFHKSVTQVTELYISNFLLLMGKANDSNH